MNRAPTQPALPATKARHRFGGVLMPNRIEESVRFMAQVDAALASLGRKTPWLCERIGESEVTLSKLRNGRAYVRWDLAVKVAEALGTTLDYLAGKEPAPPFRAEEERMLLDVILHGPRPVTVTEAIQVYNLGLSYRAELATRYGAAGEVEKIDRRKEKRGQ